jgi:hypothetical protein
LAGLIGAGLSVRTIAPDGYVDDAAERLRDAAAYVIIGDGVPYEDLGATYFDDRDQHRALRRLTRRIEALGYQVAVSPAA